MKNPLQQRYSEIYSDARYGSEKDKAHVFYHTKLEKNLSDDFYPLVLEIGAGSGEHLQYVRHGYSKYILSDIVLPENKLISKLFPKVIIQQEDAQNLNIDSNLVDRVIVTCVLHHLSDPYKSLSEIRRVAKNGASISIYLPSDPGLLYRFAQYLSSNRKLRKFFSKSELQILRGLEHRNHVASLEAMIRDTFYKDKIFRYDFPFKASWNLRLFTIYQIEISKP